MSLEKKTKPGEINDVEAKKREHIKEWWSTESHY